MAYGKIKADTLVYDNSGSDVEVTLASLVDKASLTSPDFATDITLLAAAPVKLNQTDNAAAVSIKAPGTGVTSYTITLPPVVGGTNQVLKTTDALGTLAWAGDNTLTLLDEDDFASDSAASPASQQSIKAYLDTNFATKASPTFTGGIAFEGSTADDYETAFLITDPTADRTVTFPDHSGTIALLAGPQNWAGAQRGAISSLTDASTVAVNFESSNNFKLLMTSAVGNTRELGQPSNQVEGQSGSIFVTQDGTGSRALTYHDDWKWAGGNTPTLSTAADAVDRIDYIVAETNKIHAVVTLDVKTGT